MSKYLLGATTDKELVFGEFKVTTRNGYPEFTVIKKYFKNLV